MFGLFALTPDTLPFFLTILMGFIFMAISKDGDAANISNKTKKVSVVLAGVALGILFMFYTKALPGSALQLDLATIVQYVFGGFLMGTSAIGMNQLMKGGEAPSMRIIPQPGEPVIAEKLAAKEMDQPKS